MNMRTFTTDGRMYTTDDFDSPTPTWTTIDLNALGMRGALQDVVVDAYSPHHTDAGKEWRLWVRTDSELGVVSITDDAQHYTIQHRYGLWHRVSLKAKRALARLSRGRLHTASTTP